MPSTITLNTIPLGAQGVTNFISNVNLANNTVFANTLRDIIVDNRFASLFFNGSIDPVKLAPVPGNKLITKSLSGSKNLSSGGQIAWYSIDTLDIADQAIDSRTIKDDTVGNGKLTTMGANTVKVNNTTSTANPSDLAIGANSVIGRSGTGNIDSLAAGDNSVLRRDGTGNLSFGLIGSNNLESDAKFVPGMIMMWSGSIATIPVGWGLCDGTTAVYDNRTTVKPDLRDRFIVGARQDVSGEARSNITGVLTKTGGSTTHTHDINGSNISFTLTRTADVAVSFSRAVAVSVSLGDISASVTGGAVQAHTLTINQIPSHDHPATVNDPGHAHGRGVVYPGSQTEQLQSGGPENYTNFNQNTTSNTTGITVDVGNRGGGQSHTHGFTPPTVTINQPTVNVSVTQPLLSVTQPNFSASGSIAGSTITGNNIPPFFALAFIIKL